MNFADVTVQFTTAEYSDFTRPGVLKGGMGGLLKKLMQRTTRDGRLTLTRLDVQRAEDYVKGYGDGGYQARLRVLLGAVTRAELPRS